MKGGGLCKETKRVDLDDLGNRRKATNWNWFDLSPYFYADF